MADLAQPLPYDSEAFDDALAVLVLHYLEDWSRPLAELRRVLKPGGRLVVVVNHPVIPPVMYPEVTTSRPCRTRRSTTSTASPPHSRSGTAR